MYDLSSIDFGFALFGIYLAKVVQGSFRQTPSTPLILDVPLVVLVVASKVSQPNEGTPFIRKESSFGLCNCLSYSFVFVVTHFDQVVVHCCVVHRLKGDT